MDEGKLVSFGAMGLLPPFVLRMVNMYTSDEYRTLVSNGMVTNADQFGEHEPGRVILSSIRRHLDGSVSATLTPIPHKAPDHIQRAKFDELFMAPVEQSASP